MLIFVSESFHCIEEVVDSVRVSHHSESSKEECGDKSCDLVCCHIVLGQPSMIISDSSLISLNFKLIIQHPNGKSNKIITPLFRPPIFLS